MSSLYPATLLSALKKMGAHLRSPEEFFAEAISRAQQHNGWFTPQETQRALRALGEMLRESDLDTWFAGIKPSLQLKRIGLILAGNIPAVGFHDVLCVLASGHIAVIKMSSSDDILLPALLKHLLVLAPELAAQVQYVDRLNDFDAVIATGSNNSSRYFDYYFGKVPHIIRKNRHSVAVLNGTETQEEIENLGHDIFDYFGLGCRNVSKLYLPEHYPIEKLFKPLEVFKTVADHFKYHNNYDYNKSIYLVNSASHFDNGFLLLKEDRALASPLAVLNYESYSSVAALNKRLLEDNDQIQCVVAKGGTGLGNNTGSKDSAGSKGSTGLDDTRLAFSTLPFGQSQHPKLWDYADAVDTLHFLEQVG